MGRGRAVHQADGIETLADILRVNARSHPDKVAVQEWDGQRLRDTTYQELWDRTAAFAALLRAQGLREGDAVALLMPNGRPWIVAYFGALQAGAVAVPLDYDSLDTDAELLDAVLADAEARLLIVAPADAPRAAPIAAQARATVLTFDGPTDGIPPAAQDWRPRVHPSDAAQILYTSGTTGRKKGVMLTHANVLWNVRACCARFGLREDDCLPALLPYHHAYPLTATIVLPLYAGARVPVGDVRGRQLSELLRHSRPTVLVGVPRVFEALLEGIQKAARNEGRAGRLARAGAISRAVKNWTGVNVGKLLFRSLHRRLFGGMQLRFCVSGGAQLPKRLIQEYFWLGIPLLQGWGMTELSPVGAAQPFSPRRFFWTRHYERQAGSVGPPLEGTEIELADVPEHNICVQRDGQGEMLVRGPHVMAGYHKDEHTTRRIISNRGLRTGDVARRDPEGNLFLVGRCKHVIVLPGGKKVFPEEDLYEPLARCPSIAEFTARAIQDADGSETIGLIIKPNVEAICLRGVRTLGELYRLIKREITHALRDKPDYMRRFDFCLTELRGGAFQDLVKSSLKEPCPFKNEFRIERAYSTNADNRRPLDLRPPAPA